MFVEAVKQHSKHHAPYPDSQALHPHYGHGQVLCQKVLKAGLGPAHISDYQIQLHHHHNQGTQPQPQAQPRLQSLSLTQQLHTPKSINDGSRSQGVLEAVLKVLQAIPVAGLLRRRRTGALPSALQTSSRT
ncbi:hypothetical protein BGX29_008493 [Mortierella sp. GBA35]|nr:hypothetical protein BGX29_008493 [Mortierella sp. GBA35]